MKQFSPAAERNREPLLAVLTDVLPASGTVLEVASGTGQHVACFAAGLPRLQWQPSDLAADARASVRAYIAEAGLTNVLDPIELDAAAPATWTIDSADAVICSNMIHIAPWACCEGLLAGAGRLLPAGAPLVLYGPFGFDGAFAAPSNASFDRSLRARDPRWGVRDLGDVEAVAARARLAIERVVDMPANNHSIVFRRG